MRDQSYYFYTFRYYPPSKWRMECKCRSIVLQSHYGLYGGDKDVQVVPRNAVEAVCCRKSLHYPQFFINAFAAIFDQQVHDN